MSLSLAEFQLGLMVGSLETAMAINDVKRMKELISRIEEKIQEIEQLGAKASKDAWSVLKAAKARV